MFETSATKSNISQHISYFCRGKDSELKKILEEFSNVASFYSFMNDI